MMGAGMVCVFSQCAWGPTPTRFTRLSAQAPFGLAAFGGLTIASATAGIYAATTMFRIADAIATAMSIVECVPPMS